MIKYLFILICLNIYGFSCSGDCMQCHPKLKESIDSPHHKLLYSCIKCHTKIPEGMNSCGGDCFSCHSQKKLIKSDRREHQKLSTCKECHTNKEELFKIPNAINNETNLMNLIK